MRRKLKFSECIDRGIAGSVWGLIFFAAVPVLLSLNPNMNFGSIGYEPLVGIMGSLGLVIGFGFGYIRCKRKLIK